MLRTDPPARVVPEVVRVSLWAVFGLWLARRLGRLLLLILTSPSALATITVTVAWIVGWRLVSPALPLGITTVLVVGLVVWRVRWPAGFETWVSLRVRGWLRGGWIYRRQWTTAMDTAGLTVTRNGSTFAPTLTKIISTRTVDRVRIRMLPGQTLDDYAAAAPRLAQTFGALDCRIRSVVGRVHLVDLWALITDPLATPVPTLTGGSDRVHGCALHHGLPVARAEDGTVWWLRLVGTHVLVVGATGSGKGSVIWSLLASLAVFIEAGVVKVWALDPKGGMELALGARLFDRFVHGASDHDHGYEHAFAQVLDDAVTVMRSRQDRLRGLTRLHEPSVAEPLIVIVVDELAALTGWVADRTVRRRIESALGLLLSQGRAVGVVVVGAVQDPRKDVLPMRDLFPTRIALRLSEAEQVHLTLGAGARNRGAYADLIPDSLPGVGYVMIDGVAEPVRVRFSHITDDVIATLGADTRTWSGPILEAAA